MPVELLSFTPSYCVVGAYRLITDHSLWYPIWTQSRATLRTSLFLTLPFLLISYPLTRLYVTLILSRSPFSPNNIHDAAFFGITPAHWTTFVLVLGQISAAVEWRLGSVLRGSRKVVYEATVKSRGKGPEFWQPYTEEWAEPPVERAQRNVLASQSFWKNKLATPVIRMLLLKVLLTPLSFIPFLSLTVHAAIRSLTMGKILHKPYFTSKRMTSLEIELFIVERQLEYRMFGFIAALMERMPLIGIVFSISNRIGAAMWAHDLEKHQHSYSSGQIPKTKKYESKTAIIARNPSGLPDEFVGRFPEKKGPVRIGKGGEEIGLVNVVEKGKME